MTGFVTLLSHLLCAVNVPLVVFGTTKKLGFAVLGAVCMSLIIFGRQIVISKDFFLVAFFWVIYISSVMIGVIKTGELPVLAITAASTFLLILFSGISSAFMRVSKASLSFAILSLNILIVLPFVADFYSQGYTVFFLRKYLIENAIPINSTFNQFYVLFALNVYGLLVNRKDKPAFWLFSLGALVILVLTLFSLSRQNLLASIVFVLSLLLFLVGWRKAAIFISFVVILMLALYPLIRELEQASYLVARIDRTGSQVGGGQEYSRFTQFSDSITLGAENPLFGVGIGGFYDFAEDKGYAEHIRVPEAAVNQISSEHGILMLLFFLSVYLVMCLRAYGLGFSRREAHCWDVNMKWLLSFLIGQSVLFFFNEVHFQFSFWGIYLIFIRGVSGVNNGVCAHRA